MKKLSSQLPITKPEDYKVHLASWNGQEHPLDVFVRDREKWDGWHSWSPGKNIFGRPYILALIKFYPERNIWLFGGIYKVLSTDKVLLCRKPEKHAYSYEIKRVPDYEELVGRLKICFSRPGRTRHLLLEKWFQEMFISELLEEPYSGEP